MKTVPVSVIDFDAVQTFYVDPAACGGSSEIFLTSVELYFRKKPSAVRPGNSGYAAPGVNIFICDVENDTPIMDRKYFKSNVRAKNDFIYAMADASVSTPFVFEQPLLLKTGRLYGIVVQYEDDAYELWANKTGDKIIGTNTPSPGINSARDGKFYNGTNGKDVKAMPNIDLKYKVNVAKFTANTVTVELVNKDYEFLSIANATSRFIGGETVYKVSANSTGAVVIESGNTTIIGNGTQFDSLAVGTTLVVYTNSTFTSAHTVSAIVSNTELQVESAPITTNTQCDFMTPVVAKVYYYDPIKSDLILTGSRANTALYFNNGDTIVGEISRSEAAVANVDVFNVNRFIPHIDLKFPIATTYDATYTFSYSNGTTYIVDSNNTKTLVKDNLNVIDRYEGFIVSRSKEVLNQYLYDNTARKSSLVTIAFNVDKPTAELFTSPLITEQEIDFYIQQNLVSNTHVIVDDGVPYDTEVDKNGIAISKHITKKITFASSKQAEDVRVYLDGYRPFGTDIKVYCKVHNSSDPETFDDKQWTPLPCIENSERYSSAANMGDIIEYTYGLPEHSAIANTLPGTFVVSSSNATIQGSGVDPDEYVITGDVVKVYNQLFPENYFVASVSSSNNTSITLNSTTSNSSVLGTGFKVARLNYKNVAFNNPQNDNVATYFNTSLAQFNRFDSMQIKIVFLADQTNIIPRVERITSIGVSA